MICASSVGSCAGAGHGCVEDVFDQVIGARRELDGTFEVTSIFYGICGLPRRMIFRRMRKHCLEWEYAQEN